MKSISNIQERLCFIDDFLQFKCEDHESIYSEMFERGEYLHEAVSVKQSGKPPGTSQESTSVCDTKVKPDLPTGDEGRQAY